MSLFEFVLVMVSLVLALGVTHLLREIASIVRHRDTLGVHWIPLAWIATLFLYSVSYWWALWDFQSLSWTFPGYFFLLVAPTLLYIAISLLVSADVAGPGASLIDSFERVRAPFFGLMAVFQILVTWDGWVFGVEPAWNSLRLLQGGLLAAYLLGAFSASRRVQGFVAAAALALLAFLLFVLRFLPGAFGPA